MRVFAKLREYMLSHEEPSKKIESLERRQGAQFSVVFNSIRELTTAKLRDLIQVPPKNRSSVLGRNCLLAGLSNFPVKLAIKL
jgi:hypothetical protein